MWCKVYPKKKKSDVWCILKKCDKIDKVSFDVLK